MRSETIPFYIPWITREDKDVVSNALNSRWLTGGPKVADFEYKFANYIGVEHAVAVSSCTAALHLAMRAIDIKHGDEVIVPVFTFAATANAPLFCGARPVFADIDEKTFNISSKDILNKITRRTKAIVPVHYGGQPCDMKEIGEIAEDHRLHIVEDCAHSLGAQYRNEKTGNLGTLGCFSFYPTKIITTIEGGMITTNDKQFARRIRLLREHGMTKTALDRESDASWFYDVVDLGYNYRLNEIQAALGMSQLTRVDEGIRRRVEAARYYTSRLAHTARNKIITPHEASHRSHIFHLYVIRVKKENTGITRNELYRELTGNGIGVSLHYTPLHMLSFYKQYLNLKANEFPVAERAYEEILSLPLYPTLAKEEIDSVCTKIREIIEAKA
jgi:perosamine synthetase